MSWFRNVKFCLLAIHMLRAESTKIHDSIESEVKYLAKTVQSLKNTIQKQDDIILQLQETNKEQQILIDQLMKGQRAEDFFKTLSTREMKYTKKNPMDNAVNRSRMKRRTITTEDNPVKISFSHHAQSVAFHAYKSKDMVPGAGNKIIFDMVPTNAGNGYDSNTGIFTVPKSGIYVFVWVIRICTGEHSTELTINNIAQGKTFLRAKKGDDGSVSGTVVAHVFKGDKVYIRNHPSYAGDGRIHSNLHGKPTFSGWILQ